MPGNFRPTDFQTSRLRISCFILRSMQFTYGRSKLPQMSPQSWFEPQVGYPYGFPSGPEIHRYHPDRKGVFTTKLSPSVCAEPFEACQSEVVGVNWVDGPFGCGDQIDRHLEDLKSLQTRLIRIFRKLCCRARWNSPARREIFLRSRCLSHRH